MSPCAAYDTMILSSCMAWFTARPKNDGIHMSVELPVTFIKEGDMVIAHTPALDLSTCGSNKKEALDMFNEAVRIFFNDLVENNTVDEVLPGLGWTRKSIKSDWVPPQISQEMVGIRIPVMA